MSALRRTVLLSTLLLLAAGPAPAQIGPGPFVAFPTLDTTDGRMLAFGCPGTATFEQGVSIGLATPAGEAAFTVSIFDGETGKPDGGGKPHWDFGGRQLVYRLYADPLRLGSTAPADLIGAWTGNDPNPTSGPLWTASAAAMPDNDWWGVTVSTSAGAEGPSGNFFYNLVIESDGACGVGEVLASNIKVAATSPMAFIIPRFGLEAALRQFANDGPIIYPGFAPPDPAFDFVGAATTYDGTFQFGFVLPGDQPDLRIFDGDFDHGTAGLVGVPSGTILSPCADADDPDTPADYAGFLFSTAGAAAEGTAGAGIPADDNVFDAFRRGEPGDPGRVGCVRYEVIDPNGVVYPNDNPSGNLEWEQFRIASLSADPGPADHFVDAPALPAGAWTVKIYGLDMSNLNFWFADTCSTTELGIAACPEQGVLLVGDTVWLDSDGDGLLDPGEAGIPGVVMELLGDVNLPPIATVVTGDSSAPNWEACVANNTGPDTQGLYCFGVDEPGSYTVRVAAGNFEPGGALAAHFSTTGGETQTDTVADDNVLTYDFGYLRREGEGVGTPGYWMNHPDAWPVETITIGGITYTKAQAIALMRTPDKEDKTFTMFRHLVAAKLNVFAGNEASCINATILAADLWMATYGPVGSGVKASSAAWKLGEPLATTLDRYNNGLLCAPSRG